MAVSERTDRLTRWLVPVGLALLALVLFRPVGGFAFLHLDDPVYVTENRHVKSGLTGESLRWSFNVGHASNWHPLTWTSHMLDVELFGLEAGRHHLSNLLLHTINGLLLYLLLLRLLARGGDPGPSRRLACAFVASVFLIHPQRLESVAWISERKDLLSGLFFMLTLLAYLGYARKRSIGRYLGVFALLALGLMAKPMLVTVPLLLLLVDAWLVAVPGAERPPWKRLFLEKLPLLLLSAASSLLTLAAQGVDRSMSSLAGAGLADRLGNAMVSYVAYAGALFWPSPLSVHYPFPVGGIPWWKVGGAALVLAAVSIGAVRQARRRPLLLLGWLWFLITLVPVIGLVQVGMQARADRYTYLPQIGLVIVVTFLCATATAQFAHRAPLRVAAATLALLALGFGLRAEMPYWKDDLALFERACEVSPTSAAARLGLAIEYARLGRKDEAIDQDREALEHYPDHPRAHNHLGSLLAGRGDYAGGVEHMKRALELRPVYPRAWFSLGTAHLNAGLYLEAIEALEQAIDQNPRLAVAHANLGYAREKQGQVIAALVAYERAVSLNPELFEAQLFLGSLRLRLERFGEALGPLDAASRLRPRDHRPHYRWALAAIETGDLEGALDRQRTLKTLSEDWARRLAAKIAKVDDKR